MARTGIIFGLILCGITFAGLVGIPVKTPTQFYAMMLGIPILICGVVILGCFFFAFFRSVHVCYYLVDV